MATTPLQISSERYAELVSLSIATPPVVATSDIFEAFTLPPGFGNCLLLEGTVRAVALTTPIALVNHGLYAAIYTKGAGNMMQSVDVERWYLVDDTQMACHLDPAQLVLWQVDEELVFLSAALATVGAAAAIQVELLVKRLRVP